MNLLYCGIAAFWSGIWSLNVLWCVLGPVRGRPNHFSRHSWNSQYNPWASGPLFPRPMQNKCDPDLTFDAVSTLGDATFFFREQYVDHFVLAIICKFYELDDSVL